MTLAADNIAKRQEVIARMGARAALFWFIEQAERPGSPSWARQERTVLDVLTEKDFAMWDRMWPAPAEVVP